MRGHLSQQFKVKVSCPAIIKNALTFEPQSGELQHACHATLCCGIELRSQLLELHHFDRLYIIAGSPTCPKQAMPHGWQGPCQQRSCLIWLESPAGRRKALQRTG